MESTTVNHAPMVWHQPRSIMCPWYGTNHGQSRAHGMAPTTVNHAPWYGTNDDHMVNKHCVCWVLSWFTRENCHPSTQSTMTNHDQSRAMGWNQPWSITCHGMESTTVNHAPMVWHQPWSIMRPWYGTNHGQSCAMIWHQRWSYVE